MLKAINRLRTDSDFRRVKEKGRLIQSESFALSYLDNQNLVPSRFGFVISTKISKSAVTRNRIKRMLRNSIARLIKQVKSGVDVVFLTKQKITKLDQAAISAEVERVMKSADLFT